MQTFVCPTCGIERTGLRRRCYPCTGPDMKRPEVRERIRVSLTGVRHTAARRRKNSEGHKGDGVNRFDLAAHMETRPHPFAKPVGATRVENGHIKIKCADGKWRYRARVMWEEANGPIPAGRLIHHVNLDPFDDRLDNFQMVTVSEHMRIHMTGERGRRLSALGNAARYGHT